jgi:hypothetical protein
MIQEIHSNSAKNSGPSIKNQLNRDLLVNAAVVNRLAQNPSEARNIPTDIELDESQNI